MYLYPLAVVCPFEPPSYSLYVRYHCRDVLIVVVAVVCSNIVGVVGLIVSGILSIVDAVFMIKFVLSTV